MRITIPFLVVLCATLPTHAATLYGAGHVGQDAPSTLYVVDPATGGATAIGPIGFNLVGGLDTHPQTGTLFGMAEREDGTAVFIAIDIHTGAGSEVGPLLAIPAPSQFAGGLFDLSFRESDSELFASALVTPVDVSCPDGTSVVGIATIDPATGAATEVGPTPNCAGGNALAFLPDGSLILSFGYVIQSSSGPESVIRQWTLDPATGEVLSALDLVLPPELDPGAYNRLAAMDVHPATGELYAVSKSGGQGAGGQSLHTIDPVTGEMTTIGPTTTGMDALAWRTEVQVPGLMATGRWGLIGVLGLGLAVLAWKRA